MKREILIFAVVAALIVACNNSDRTAAKDTQASLQAGVDTVSDSILYESESLSSFVDARRRGAGIISFTLDINDRLDIWNMDDTKFGDIVLNEDLTYFTL